MIKEIIYRKIHFNEKKLEALGKAKDDFTREAILDVAKSGKKEQQKRGMQLTEYQIKFSRAKDILAKHIDILEADRIL